MDCIYYATDNTSYLEHHGVKNQKWGVRRYQNEDGTWTEEGKARRRNGVPKGFGITRYTDSNGRVSQEGKEHYMRKKGRIMSDNTLDRTKQGARIGAAIGATTGLGIGLGLTALTAGVGAPAVAVGTAFCSSALYAGMYSAAGALNGVRYGLIIGAAETSMGRDYINRQMKSEQEG